MRLRKQLSDMEPGYKLSDRTLLDQFSLRSNRFDLHPEITARVRRSGVRIYEVPILYAGRELSEGNKITWRDGFSALRALLKYRFVD